VSSSPSADDGTLLSLLLSTRLSLDQADREEQLANLQEDTEQRMNSVVDALPDGERCTIVPTRSAPARVSRDT